MCKIVTSQETSLHDCSMVIAFHNEGYSYRDIEKSTGVSKSTANYIVNRYEETQSVNDRHRSGRPSNSTPRDDRNLVNLVKKNRRAPSHQLASEWELSNGKKASSSTVRRRLLAKKFFYKATVKNKIDQAPLKMEKSCSNVSNHNSRISGAESSSATR